MARRLQQFYLFLVYAFLYAPILILVAFSFNESKYAAQWTGFSLKWYDKLAGSRMLMDAALNSFLVATLAATLATIIGTLAAVSFFRYRFRGKGTLQGLLYVVMMTPDIVMGISLLALFIAAGMALGFWSLLLSHITFCLPFVVVTVYSRLAGFDVRIIEAARDLGADEWRTFLHVILPLALPAVAAGWLLSFTLSLDDVIVSFFVTGPQFEILPLKIYSMVRLGVKPEVNALCTVIFGLSLVLVILSQLLLRSGQGETGRA